MIKSKSFKYILMLTVVGFFCMTSMFMSNFVNATERYKVLGDNDLFISGYLSQRCQFMFNKPKYESTSGLKWYQKDGAIKGASSIITTLFIETQLNYGDSWEYRLGLRGEMDTADLWHTNNSTWDSGAAYAWDEFADVEDISRDDKINDIVRECTVAYFSRYLTIRAGKQQLGWGEADGVRLMDVINALDLRKDFILRDGDEGFNETRIPVWMLRADITPDYDFGHQLGTTNLDLELIWIIDKDVSNRQAIGPREGGPWGAPLPDLPLPLKQLNLKEDGPGRTMSDSSFGVRLKGMFGSAFFTLNYFYGWQKGPVLKHSGNTGFTGNVDFILDPSFEGNVADAGPDLGAIPPGMGGSPFDGYFGVGSMLNAATGGLTPATWYGLSLDLKKKLYRAKIVGGTFSKELQIRRFARMLGQKTLPVLRAEVAYEFDHPFNIGIKNKPETIYSDWIWLNTIEYRDILKYLIGLDWNSHIPFINKKDDVWVSAQFTQNRISGSLYSDQRSLPSLLPAGIGYPGGARQRLQYAPYYWFAKKWETTSSLLMNTAYWNDDLKPQVMFVYDWTYGTFAGKYRLRYEIGDHWRIDVAYEHLRGNSEEFLDIFGNLDNVYTIVKYLF